MSRDYVRGLLAARDAVSAAYDPIDMPPRRSLRTLPPAGCWNVGRRTQNYRATTAINDLLERTAERHNTPTGRTSVDIKHQAETTAASAGDPLHPEEALAFLSALPTDAIARGRLTPIMRDVGSQRDPMHVLHGLRVEWTSDS